MAVSQSGARRRFQQPERGYLVFSTDFDLSSHLQAFSLSGGVDPGPQLHVQVGYAVPALEYDQRTDTFFVPSRVFGAFRTRRRLTAALGQPPCSCRTKGSTPDDDDVARWPRPSAHASYGSVGARRVANGVLPEIP